MKRPILLCALLLATAGAMAAQQGSQSDQYSGQSNPPPDDTIVTDTPAQPKPPAGRPMTSQPSYPAPSDQQSNSQIDPGIPASDQWRGSGAPTSSNPPATYSARPEPTYPVPPDYEDDGALHQRRYPNPNQRNPNQKYAADPDGDIVHPEFSRPGELGEGTTIRVRLMQKLSSRVNESGETFRTRVGSDVVRGGQVLIPAGAEIDGHLAEVSKGHVGGYGTMRLRPETVIMPDGRRFRLYAEVTATPGSSTKVEAEGTIRPGSRVVKDGVEYGAAVGGGAVAGALLGGPVGAVTGGAVGAGFVTVHLLANHPQATLEPGTALQFTLTEPLYLSSNNPSGN